jgi:Lrp/AsnC family transcriptional regulator, regulator for asnA, asnC and gidA
VNPAARGLRISTPARRPDRPLDEIDAEIIRLLQQDGRMPYRAIARELGVVEGTVRLRVDRLFESGTLTIAAIADPFQLGYSVLAFSLLNVVPERLQQVIDTLVAWDEITYVSSCTGRADLYVQIVCRDNAHLRELLHQRLPSVGGITGSETFMELQMHKVSYVYPHVKEMP